MATCVGLAEDAVHLSRTSDPVLGRLVGQLPARPGGRRFKVVQWTGQEIVGMHLEGDPKRYVRWWEPAGEGRPVRMAVEWVRGYEPPAGLTVETVARTGPLPDGRWLFRVGDAATRSAGPKAMRFHEWPLVAERGGNYSVEVTGGAWHVNTEAVEVELCGQTREGQLDYLDSRHRVVNKVIGWVRVPGPGAHRLKVQVGEPDRSLQGAISAVMLRPAPEGERLRSGVEGGYGLRAVDATLAGGQLQVLGAGDQSTVPGWTDTLAGLEWLCEDVRPGRYAVEWRYHAGHDAAGEVVIEGMGQTLRVPLRSAAGGGGEVVQRVGEWEVTRGGDYPVRFHPRTATGSWSFGSVRLTPMK
jgi:hypothetical protein